MKRLMHAILAVMAFFILLSATACKKEICETCTEGPDVPSPVTPVPIGETVGAPFTDMIGPEGGTIKSPDGRIEIIIPQGALTKETEISIQPLKNTSPGGVGNSYRLTPHGKIFKKKATVRFSYENDEPIMSSTQALGIAYQTEKGVWTLIKESVKNPVAKTISVQTDHSSDWTFIEQMQLDPAVKTIGLSEKVTLIAYEYATNGTDDNILGSFDEMDPKYIVKWTLNGPGTLVGNGEKAVYTAPSVKPSKNTATITLELNVKGKQVLLISTIYVTDEGISISINGGDWHTYPGIAKKNLELNKFTFGTYLTGPSLPVIIFWWPIKNQVSNGLYLWNILGDEDAEVIFRYTFPDLKKIYASEYEDEEHEVRNSIGFLDVKEIQQNGKKYITGSFLVRKSGLFSVEEAEQIGIGNVVGTFKVLRNW